jgi:hypothetical protein
MDLEYFLRRLRFSNWSARRRPGQTKSKIEFIGNALLRFETPELPLYLWLISVHDWNVGLPLFRCLDNLFSSSNWAIHLAFCAAADPSWSSSPPLFISALCGKVSQTDPRARHLERDPCIQLRIKCPNVCLTNIGVKYPCWQGTVAKKEEEMLRRRRNMNERV